MRRTQTVQLLSRARTPNYPTRLAIARRALERVVVCAPALFVREHRTLLEAVAVLRDLERDTVRRLGGAPMHGACQGPRTTPPRPASWPRA